MLTVGLISGRNCVLNGVRADVAKAAQSAPDGGPPEYSQWVIVWIEMSAALLNVRVSFSVEGTAGSGGIASL
jgi:hypothetical protein